MDDVSDAVSVAELGISEDVMKGSSVVEKNVTLMVSGMLEDIVITTSVVDVSTGELVEDTPIAEELTSDDDSTSLDDIEEEDGSRELLGITLKVLNPVLVTLKETLELDSMLLVGREELDTETVELGRSEEVCRIDELSDGNDELGRREDVTVVEKIVLDECVEETTTLDVEETTELVVDVVVVCCTTKRIPAINPGAEI